MFQYSHETVPISGLQRYVSTFKLDERLQNTVFAIFLFDMHAPSRCFPLTLAFSYCIPSTRVTTLHLHSQTPSLHTRNPTPLQHPRHKRLNIPLPNRRIETRTPIRGHAPGFQTPPSIPIPTARTIGPPQRPRGPSRPSNILLILRHIVNQFRDIARAPSAIRAAEFRNHGFEAVALEPGGQGR